MENHQLYLNNNSGFKWYHSQHIYVKGFIFDKKNTYYEKENLLKYFESVETFEDFNGLVEEANGSFSVIIKNEDNIFIAVDKIRTFPLFYTFKNDQFVISDLCATFLNIDKEIILDKSSLVEFKASGFVSGKYTLLKEVYQVRAGELLTIVDKKITSRIYYTYSISKPANLSLTENQNQLELLFQESFKRLIKSLNKRTVVIPLSGGYDSRLIAVLFKSLGYENVICYTYGKKNNPEVNISKTVANKLKYEWHFIEYKKDLLEDLLEDEVFIKYCPFNTNHHTMIFLQEFFAVKFLNENNLIPDNAIFLPGHSGDFLGGSQLIKNGISEANISIDKINDVIFKKKYFILPSDNNDKRIINDRIKQSLESYNLTDKKLYSYSIFEDWDFKEKIAKVIFNSSNVYSFFGYEYRFPFWDNELVDFFKYLPYKQKFLKNLYDKTLREKFFSKYDINFETELQTTKWQTRVQQIKNFLKNNSSESIRKKILLKNDSFATEYIANQMIEDLNKYGINLSWGRNINSIQIQWFLEKLKLSMDRES